MQPKPKLINPLGCATTLSLAVLWGILLFLCTLVGLKGTPALVVPTVIIAALWALTWLAVIARVVEWFTARR